MCTNIYLSSPPGRTLGCFQFSKIITVLLGISFCAYAIITLQKIPRNGIVESIVGTFCPLVYIAKLSKINTLSISIFLATWGFCKCYNRYL